MLSRHPQISGFSNTGVEEDEGQHLQKIIRPAKAFGGPGKFAFDARSYLDETSELATAQSATAILADWEPWWDVAKPVWLEKSPPTLVRTRFFQALFPGSRFIVIVRHPLIVARATQRWSKAGLTELVLHWCLAHQRFMQDVPFLGSHVMVVRYEDGVAGPGIFQRRMLAFLDVDADSGLPPLVDENAKYAFDPEVIAALPVAALEARFGDLFEHFGYQLAAPEKPPSGNPSFPGV
jgi:hypothetical protein